MTGGAAVGGVVVLLGDDVGDLIALAAGPDGVAIAAAYTVVGAVGENGTENVSRLRRSAVGGKLVADIARADLALGRVAREAVVVGLDAGGDRLARTGRRVTMSTARGWAAFAIVVGRVVKLHVKALAEFERKGLDGRRVGFELVVADRAHRAFGADELIEVTAYAGIVTGEFQLALLGLTTVTRNAFKLLMLLDLVRELIKRRIGNASGRRIGRLGRGQRRRRPGRLLQAAGRE